MPNRKREVGWYHLPKSKAPYYGEIPDGAKRLSDSEVKKLGDQRDVAVLATDASSSASTPEPKGP